MNRHSMTTSERALLDPASMFDFSGLDDIGSSIQTSLDLHAFEAKPLQDVDCEIKAILAQEDEKAREKARESLARRGSALSIPPLQPRESKASLVGVPEETQLKDDDVNAIPLPPSSPSPRRMSTASVVSNASRISVTPSTATAASSTAPSMARSISKMGMFSNLFRKRTPAEMPPTPATPPPVPIVRSSTLNRTIPGPPASVRTNVALDSVPAPLDPLPSTPVLTSKSSKDSLPSSTSTYPASTSLKIETADENKPVGSRSATPTLTPATLGARAISSTPVPQPLKLDLEIGSSSFLDDFSF
ncbi:UNVERIFIED_CONTAM: hypothetical protein HDU68_012029 [Siphonaria sp. JEL0065]|nr:hypothetical protein HDU68_012029 [Siphonaria sp. JEL0065]